ncbi:hypothetical protein [Halanaerobium kushneri]|uniref:Uncharacterized protein n=1 Tax=Halanaerobium kushneri TaxID=56779 RepID=A0A1N6RT00_9FIRM|nr:hypothetical protein [Halanaerobium kushneri]SIQ31938.1 hypothetical protein SAMN05421834_10394 [Halanaerobium kushneri]
MEDAVSNFFCEKNLDVENFLRENAINREKRDLTRTYLIIDQNKFESDNEINIVAYFSIALKTLIIPQTLSNSKIKKIDGFSKDAKESIVYLIGQLARNDDYNTEAITGAEILARALNIISDIKDKIGGKVVLVECEDQQKVIDFNLENDFERLPEHSENELINAIKEIIASEEEITSPIINAINEIIAIHDEKRISDYVKFIKFI